MKLPTRVVRVWDFGQQLAEVDKDVLDYFHVNVIRINRTLEPSSPYFRDKKYRLWFNWGINIEIPEEINIIDKGTYYDAYIGNSIIGRMPKSGYYFESLHRWREYTPIANVKSVTDVENYNWDRYKVSIEYLKILRKSAAYTDYALMHFGGFSIHEWGQSLRGWDTLLSDLRIRKPLAEAIIDHMFEIQKYNVENTVRYLGECIQIVGFGDNFGTEEGPQISVQTFREFHKHRYEELFKIVKKYSRTYIFFHSCGSIYPFIKEFIDVGADLC